MNSLVCVHCKTQNRVTKPIMVPYIHRRHGDSRGERRSFWACSYCDSVDMWPVYSRTSPPIPQE